MATISKERMHRASRPAHPTAATLRGAEEHQHPDSPRLRTKPSKGGSAVAAKTSPSHRVAARPQRITQPPRASFSLEAQSPPTRGVGFTIEKAFTVLGFAVGALLVLLFGVDLVIGVPFDRASLTFDIASVSSGAILLYLSLDVLRDQRRLGLW
jgi:hypothetical protein